MPTVSDFYGIKIQVFHNDHGIPHFRALCSNGQDVVYSIATLEHIIGEIPTNKQKLVEAWAIIHHKELIENGKRVEQGLRPHKIKGLK